MIGNGINIQTTVLDSKSDIKEPLAQPAKKLEPELTLKGGKTIKNNKILNNTRKLKSYYMIK